MAEQLTITITAKDGASQTFRAVGQSAQQMGQAIDKAGQSGQALTSITDRISGLETEFRDAGAAITAFGAVTTAAVGVGVKNFLSLESAMANVASIAGDADIAGLTDQVRGLAVELGTSPTGLAEGLYDIVSSGVEASDAMQVLEVSAIAARAGLTDTATSARAVTAILNAYKLEAEDAGDVSDVLFQTVNSGVITFEALANNLSQTVPLAANLNVEITELAAAYTELTLQSFSATQAETGIANILRATINPTVALTEAVQEYGYASAEALIQAEGLGGFLAFLEEQTGGSAEALLELLGTAEGTTAAIALLSGGVEQFNARTAEMEGAAQDGATTLGVLETQMATTQAAIDRAQAAFTDLSITIGAAIAPAINVAADAASGWAAVLSSLPDPLQQAAAGATALTGATALVSGGLLLVIPQIASTVTALQRLRAAFGATAAAAALTGGSITAIAAGFTALAFPVTAASATAANFVNAVRDGQGPVDAMETAVFQLASAMQQLGEGDPVGFFRTLIFGVEGATNSIEQFNTTATTLLDEAARQMVLGNTEVAESLEFLAGRTNATLIEAENYVDSAEFMAQANAVAAQTTGDVERAQAQLREEFTQDEAELRVYTEAVNALAEAMLDPANNASEIDAAIADLTTKFYDGEITLDQYREGLVDLARQYGTMPGEIDKTTASLADLTEGADSAVSGITRVTDAAKEGQDALADLATTVAESGGGFAAYRTYLNELNAAQRQAELDFIATALSVAGLDDALSQLNLTSYGTDVSRLAEATGTANTALESTFQIIVEGSNALGQNTQAVEDWITSLVGAEGEWAAIDDLLAAGAITTGEYNAAIQAQSDILTANAAVQQEILAIQTAQAPLIAELTTQQAAYVAQIGELPAQQQALALAYMDTNTQAQLQTIIMQGAAVAAGDFGTAGRTAFEGMIEGAVALNPLLELALTDIGLVARDHEGNLIINYDSLEGAQSEMDRLITSLDTLASVLAQIFGIEIEVEGQEEVDAVIAAIEQATGKTITVDADAEPAATKLAGVHDELDALDGQTATVSVDAQLAGLGGAAGGLLDFAAGGTDINAALGIPESVEVPVTVSIQGGPGVGDGTGGAANWNDLLDVPEEVVTHVAVTTSGTEDVESLNTIIEEASGRSTTVSIAADVTGFEEIGSLYDILRNLEGTARTVTIDVQADTSDVDSALLSLGIGGEGGAAGFESPTVYVDVEIGTNELDPFTPPEISPVEIPVTADAGGPDGALTVISDITAGGKEPREVTVDVGADTSAFTAAMLGVQSTLATLDSTTVTVEVDGVDDASDEIDTARNNLTSLDGNTATVFALGNNAGALNAINSAAGALGAINGDTATVYINGVNNVGGAVGAAASALASIDGRTATTYIRTVYQTVGSAAGAAFGSMHGGIPELAHGGVTARMGEAGPELLHFANGGTALAPFDAVYTVPPMTYVSPANASAGQRGGDTYGDTYEIHIHGNVYGIDELDQALANAVAQRRRTFGGRAA